jgi:predicted HicB family RNase H-like nuclease
MEKFEVDTSDGKIQSINRTIRLKAELYDQLILLSEETGVSLNRLINQCVAYALRNMNEKFE